MQGSVAMPVQGSLVGVTQWVPEAIELRKPDRCKNPPYALLSCWVQVFFCKYNDPIYVKLEKLEVMIMLANERNIDQVCTNLHTNSLLPG